MIIMIIKVITVNNNYDNSIIRQYNYNKQYIKIYFKPTVPMLSTTNNHRGYSNMKITGCYKLSQLSYPIKNVSN